MIARISEGRALESLCRVASSGLRLIMFCIVGTRNPSVLPVPVRACAMLRTIRQLIKGVGLDCAYMSVPFRAWFMVAL